MRLLLRYIAILLLIFSGNSCKDEPLYSGECFIPDIAVNEVVNISLPEYFVLQDIGGFVQLDGGNRGIFVVHNYDDIFYALERTCPYESDKDCSVIHVDSLNLRLRCGTYADTGFVECCASKYQFSGLVTEGPSRCNLKPYRINKEGNLLYINN